MHKFGLSWALLMCLCTLGCGKSGGKYETYKVTGKVMMNGAPVAGASVAFSPVAQGKPAALGQTDTQGIYILTTYDAGDGAVEGEYKVMITKSAPSSQAPTTPTHDPTGKTSATPTHSGGGKGKPASTGHLLPEKFSKAATTPITKKVEAKDNTIDVDLDQAK